jgi:predicted MFS family arabinose efflux permease
MTSHNNREHCAENISAMSPGPVPSRIGEERLDVHIYDDHGDPHKAALENGQAPRISSSTWAAIFFLGFTFQPSLSFTISTVFPILIPMSLDVQGSTLNSNWMASSWSLTSSISLAIAGQLSDIFGRKHILMAGQVLLIIGHIVGSTANTVSQLIAAMSILGLGTGTTFV